MYRKTATALSRVLILVAAASLLAACSLPAARPPSPGPASTPTLSPEQVQTQINQMLTQLPTTEGQQAALQTATPTLPLPTVPAEATESPVPVITATQPPTAEVTAEQPAPTSTTAPAAAPTATLAQTTPEAGGGAPGGGVPTVGVTPVSPAATALPPSGPTFTPAPGDPRARLGAPTSTDPMNDASTWIWPTGTDQYTTGTFAGGYQSVTALTGTDGWRMANPLGREFGNLYLEATIRTTTCSGSDHYGLIFRVPVVTDPDQGYLFGVTCDGRYSLRRWNSEVGTRGEMRWLVNWTASPAIASGSNQTNRLGAMIVGGRILLYSNGTLLTEVQDTLYPSGYFGVFVGSDNTDKLNIQIDEMSYWENPTP